MTSPLEKLQDQLKEKLANARVTIDSRNERNNLAQLIMKRLQTFGMNENEITDSALLISYITEALQNAYKRLDNSVKVEWQTPKEEGFYKKGFVAFVEDAIDEGWVDFTLSKKYGPKSETAKLIKQRSARGAGFYIRHILALSLSEQIPKDSTVKDIDDVLYGSDTSEPQILVEASSLNRNARFKLDKAEKAKKNQYSINAYFEKKEAQRLQSHLSHTEQKASERVENTENFEQATEFAEGGSEVTKLLGEISEKSHTLLHFSEHLSKSLSHTGGIGTLVAGTLGIITIPLLCALEKRRPKPTEMAQMGLSLTVIVLGALALAAVGGPLAAGIFIFAATTIGLGRTAVSFFHEWRERKALEKEVNHLREEINHIVNEIDEKRNNITQLNEQLTKEFSNPAKINHEKIKELRSRLETSLNELETLSNTLENKNVVLAKKSAKLLELREKRTSRWELAKKGIYASSGVLAIVGAALMLTPAAPVGGILMVVASLMSITTLAGSFIARQVKRYQMKNAQLKAEESVQEAKKIETSSTDEEKMQFGHSSEYHIAELLSPNGNLRESLAKGAENAYADNHHQLKDETGKYSQNVVPYPSVNNEKTLKVKGDKREKEEEGEGEGERPEL
ncbi:hypothetical protein E3983_11665 [Legionella israelensis]|uniref:Coiled-coil protein n=1 Tax=Legionella israelensis TaxID=454 RepID=A0AAX1EII5_9GAMM|nr:hypothetical protein [Legionella israelensis]QBR84950.1 hypothetical protein E3983_11665 [Legionella israelensis]